MKNIMKKSVGVILILLTLLYTLTGCYLFEYSKGSGLGIGLITNDLYAKVKSDKRFFDKENVTLDFYIGLYYAQGTIESQKEQYAFETANGNNVERHFAIYLSDSEEIIFEKDGNEYALDIENKVNARLWKYISYEDAFSTDYGYTHESMIMDYHHKEKITIPQDMFDLSSGSVFVHIVDLRYVNNEAFMIGYCGSYFEIKYKCFYDKIVLI